MRAYIINFLDYRSDLLSRYKIQFSYQTRHIQGNKFYDYFSNINIDYYCLGMSKYTKYTLSKHKKYNE